MTTEVILTGTGVPHPSPGRAGAGTFVRSGEVRMQFDAGRATALRLVDAGTHPTQLNALFLTHHHSDHVQDVADVTMSRWLHQQVSPTGPLVIVCPEGATERFVRRMLEPYQDDIAVRTGHTGALPPQFELITFAAGGDPSEVWRSEDGTVCVDAVAVHHEPVLAAVAYRIRTPDGIVVVSGDTRVCDEVAQFAAEADVLVHEACRTTALAAAIAGTVFETIFSYHADTVALGSMAEQAGVRHLVLTHLIPAPENEAGVVEFESDVRQGGYRGRVTVGADLARIIVGEGV